jgi:hypothetical protein
MVNWLKERDRLERTFVTGLKGRPAVNYLLDLYRCDQKLGFAHPEHMAPPTDRQAELRRTILKQSGVIATYELAMMQVLGDGPAQRLIYRAAGGDKRAIREVLAGWEGTEEE